jgi:predicted acyltransferase
LAEDPTDDSKSVKNSKFNSVVRSLGFPLATTALWLYCTYRYPFAATPNGPFPTLFPTERIADEKRTAAYVIDEAMVGVNRLYRKGLDPEGLLGSLTGVLRLCFLNRQLIIPLVEGVINVWAGVLLGNHLRSGGPDIPKLAGTSALLGLVSYLLTRPPLNIPFSKKLWTPSFALATSAFAVGATAATFALSSLRKQPAESEKLESPLVKAGRNSLSVYLLQSFLPHILFLTPGSKSVGDWLREVTVTKGFGKSGMEGLAWGLGWAGVCMWAAGSLERKGWVVKV